MATWLSHFRVADNILRRFKFSKVDFLWGNIAPDCGVPAKSGGFNPPKEVTHLAEGSKSRCDYSRFYREMIDGRDYDTKTYSFLMGYYTHLMADVLWSRLINNPCKEKNSELYKSDRDEYYRRVKPEWYANDHLFISRNPNEWYLKELYSVDKYPVTCIPYYGVDYVERQLHHIRDYYMNPPQYSTDFHYLTPQMTDEWVETAANAIGEGLALIGEHSN